MQINEFDENVYRPILLNSRGGSPLPYLLDDAVQVRAKKLADAQDITGRLQCELHADAPIPIFKRSDYRAYQRNGMMEPYDNLHLQRMQQIDQAAMGCYLGMDTLDYLQDLLWAECESSWWYASSLEYVQPIDLWVAMKATQYAILLTLFQDRLEPEVSQRLREEIYRRALDPYLLPETAHLWWWNTTNNWNAVCHGGIGIAAMLLENRPAQLTEILSRVLGALPIFLDGFTEDGGCTEGPSYWRYGFGWYVKFAEALYHFTGERLNLMQQEKIARICRYPLAVTIRPGQEFPFADAHVGYQSPATVSRINQYVAVPELFGLCELTNNGQVKLCELEDLLCYDERIVTPLRDTQDYFLPDVGVVKVVMGSVTLGAKAGHNDEHHNHNDVGSFVLHRDDTMLLIDPGAPVYTSLSFGPHRYESILTNSYGHSVPVINGCLQQVGRQYAGTLEVQGENSGASRVVRIEMAGAYGLPELRQLSRRFTVPANEGPILLSDTFVFSTPPSSLEEVFITSLPVEIIEEGAAIQLVAPRDEISAVLRAIGTPGSFFVEELPQTIKESHAGTLLRRITFIPTQLAIEMMLQFSIE